jgi:lysophospholipase L1-like esterase
VLESHVQQAQGLVQPPQIDAVSPTTDLVTVGLGGNDLDFAYTSVFQCVLAAGVDPEGSPCEDANERKVPRLLDRIEKRYAATLDAIADRAPDARILVVGYPRLLEDSTGCPRRFPIAEGDVAFVRRSFDRLNETVAAVADEAGLEYVDVAAASKGHDICSDEPWINGRREDRRTGAAPYHPMPAEQEAVADLILELL